MRSDGLSEVLQELYESLAVGEMASARVLEDQHTSAVKGVLVYIGESLARGDGEYMRSEYMRAREIWM